MRNIKTNEFGVILLLTMWIINDIDELLVLVPSSEKLMFALVVQTSEIW